MLTVRFFQKNSVILLFSISTILIGCSEDKSNSSHLTYRLSNDVATKYVIYKDFDICAQSTDKVICNLNLSVHTSLKYGEGPDEDLDPAELIKFGVGNCGHYAFLLKEELKNLNINVENISIFSTHGAIHALLEAKTQEGNFLLDPTLGLFYSHDFYTIVTNPSVSQDFKGVIPSNLNLYGGYHLFESVDFFIFNDDTTYTTTENDLSSYISVHGQEMEIDLTNSFLNVDFITVKFNAPINFYSPDGFKFTYTFGLDQGDVGVNIPLNGNRKIHLIFDDGFTDEWALGNIEVIGSDLTN